jgi:hypothetical protein
LNRGGQSQIGRVLGPPLFELPGFT